jgi:hypothetical protein
MRRVLTQNNSEDKYFMDKAYLTADEIYAIDRLTELELPDYLISLEPEKQALVSHIFSKNRSLLALKVIADEKDEGVKRLHKILEEHRVASV